MPKKKSNTPKKKPAGDYGVVVLARLRIDRILDELHLGSTITTLRRALAPVLNDPALKESLAMQLTRYAAREWAERVDLYRFVMGNVPKWSPKDLVLAMCGDAEVRADLLN